jgi:hypothetical protein
MRDLADDVRANDKERQPSRARPALRNFDELAAHSAAASIRIDD